MQVLKFGGTSVANAEAMLQTLHIVEKALEADRTIVVSSAISGCTDGLIEMGRLAAARDKTYLERLEHWQQRHRAIISTLLPEGYRSKTQAAVDALFDELASILQGVFLLGELSPTSLSAVESFGELLSTRILTDCFLSQGIACRWLDARELILVRDGVVEEAESYRRMREAVEQHTRAELFIVPGFIARDQDGVGPNGVHPLQKAVDPIPLIAVFQQRHAVEGFAEVEVRQMQKAHGFLSPFGRTPP